MTITNKFRSIRRLVILSVSVVLAANAFARNVVYQDTEVILDRPEGELKYFKAYYKCHETDSSRAYHYDSEKGIMVVYAPDGSVYIKNLVTDLWIKAIMEEGNLVIPSGSLADFVYFNAYYFPDSALKYLQLGRYDPEKQSIAVDDSLDNLVFVKNENGGYTMKMEDNCGIYRDNIFKYLYYDYELTPLEEQPIIPPAGYPEEDYQINFMPFPQTYGYSRSEQESKKASLLIKAVRTPDTFYLKGLSFFNNPDLWIKGEIRGNKVVFPNATFIGYNNEGKELYMNSVKYEHVPYSSPGRGHMVIDITALGEDLIFDYDPITGNLTNPSACINFESKPNYSWEQDLVLDSFILAFIRTCDFFNESEIIKIPEGYEYKPCSPIIKKYYSGECEIRVNYQDAHGYMMDPYKMYLVFYKNDGDPLVFNCLDVETMTKEETTEVPYATQYVYITKGLDGIGPNLVNNQVFKPFPHSLDFPEGVGWAQLIYKDDDGYTSSSPSFSSVKLPVEDNAPFGINEDKDVIYDLTGRRVNPQNIAPGIYIRNGKKYIIPTSR